MIESYPVITVPQAAQDSVEQMGTKRKFWFHHTDGARWLFKFNRPDHGEDWSEKIACECAGILGIPRAQVELATCESQPGVISRDFLTEQVTEQVTWLVGALVHGNELLVQIDAAYPAKGANFRVTAHTVDRVVDILSGSQLMPPRGFAQSTFIASAVDVFIGYLMLDALVGNTDRHHENWAVIAGLANDDAGRVVHNVRLAPTFDHASSLGRELSDAARIDMLTPGRNRSVATYAGKTPSRLYRDVTAKRPLSPLEAFRLAGERSPLACAEWIKKLRDLPESELQVLIDRVPSQRMSEPARRFASELIRWNRHRILS